MDIMQKFMDEVNSTTVETIYRKEFVTESGVSVFADISALREKASGNIINATFNVHFNGLYVKNPPNEYRDALKLAQEIVATLNRGEDPDIELC